MNFCVLCALPRRGRHKKRWWGAKDRYTGRNIYAGFGPTSAVGHNAWEIIDLINYLKRMVILSGIIEADLLR